MKNYLEDTFQLIVSIDLKQENLSQCSIYTIKYKLKRILLFSHGKRFLRPLVIKTNQVLNWSLFVLSPCNSSHISMRYFLFSPTCMHKRIVCILSIFSWIYLNFLCASFMHFVWIQSTIANHTAQHSSMIWRILKILFICLLSYALFASCFLTAT